MTMMSHVASLEHKGNLIQLT